MANVLAEIRKRISRAQGRGLATETRRSSFCYEVILKCSQALMLLDSFTGVFELIQGS